MSNSFYKNRRLKSLLFFVACSLVAVIPHFFLIEEFLNLILFLSLVIALYGLIVISKNIERAKLLKTHNRKLSDQNLPH